MIIPKAIEVLQGKRRTFNKTIPILDECCAKNNARGDGCMYLGLCRTLYAAKETEWGWERDRKIKLTLLHSRGRDS